MYEKTVTHCQAFRLRGLKLFVMVLLLVFGFSLTAGARNVSAATTNGFKIVSENGKKVCYYYKKGVPVKNSFVTIKTRKYYFDEKGHQVIGWQKDENGEKIRYFANKLGSLGYMYTGFKKYSNGSVRYFDPSTGMMAKGWLTLSDGKRYFKASNGLLYTGLKKVGGAYYYFKANSNKKKSGIMYTKGFVTISGKKYFFQKSGKARTGWLTSKGLNYYFDKSGAMYTDTVITVDGVKYLVDSKGVCSEFIPQQTGSGKAYTYEDRGAYVVVKDEIRNRSWNLVSEFKTDLGVANGQASDRDILAALVESEAGCTGLIGMEAVALTVLNRTIHPYFPSEVRYVVYQECNSSHTPGHSVVRYPVSDPWMNRRLKGGFDNKALAYQAVDEAYRIFNNYLTNGSPRVIEGLNEGKDFNYKYFMTPASFKALGLKCESFTWNNMTFFVDWPL